MTAAPESNMHFMTVGAAAEHLGISRLKLREGVARRLILARRDNEGNLRIDLSAMASDAAQDLQGADLAASDLMDMLFDEVQELEAQLEAQLDGQNRMADLLARQADAMDRAESVMVRSSAEQSRLTDLLDRAMAHLETKPPDDILLPKALAQSARFGSLLDRALRLSETGTALAPTTDRAFDLLERAVAHAETARDDANDAVGRSKTLSVQVENQTATIQDHKSIAERALAMSERALSTARHPPRRGFFARLLGI